MKPDLLIHHGEVLLGRSWTFKYKGLELLRGATIDEDWHHLMLALATRSYNSLMVAARALRDGFPVQAMILARAVYEDMQTAGHILNTPSERAFWLDPKYGANEKAAQEVPRFGDMRIAMPDQQLAQWLRDAYFTLSQFSHPTGRSLRAEWSVGEQATPSSTSARVPSRISALPPSTSS